MHIIKGKLDKETRKQWELSLNTKDVPTYENLSQFLEQRARALAASQTAIGGARAKFLHTENKQRTERVHTPQGKGASAYSGTVHPVCAICSEKHEVFKCPTFINASVKDRRGLVVKNSLCFNCLRGDHRASKCKSGSCRHCKMRHNSLLHLEDTLEKDDLARQSETDVHVHLSRRFVGQRQVLLSTAVIQIKDAYGRLRSFRALLDSASQASFVTQRCAQLLNLNRIRSDISVSGIGSSGTIASNGCIEFLLHSRMDTTVKIPVQAYILPRVTRDLPSSACDIKHWTHIQGLELADPAFHVPGRVDILLGADIYVQVLREGHRRGPPGTPNAFNTVFGWVLLGSTDQVTRSNAVTVLHCSLEEQVKHFWELEEAPPRNLWTEEEAQCELHFSMTSVRNEAGRYVVRLPFKTPKPELGMSKELARWLFLKTERKLKSNESFREKYVDFMQEYELLGHMELIPSQEKERAATQTFYLPHHAVLREASTTTKVRVVFNGSAKSTTGVSLNDTLLVGPKVQDDLVNLLIRFRFPLIVMTADLEKMYRQILINEEDANYQRIFWRPHEDEPLHEYRLLTVTYGTASAPYLATRVLQQLSRDEGDKFPLAAAVLSHDFYVDDLLTGCDSKEEAFRLQTELTEITRQGGFELRKWSSNNQDVMNSIPVELRGTNNSLHFQEDEPVKTLGLSWHPSKDEFSFRVDIRQYSHTITKRTILSEIASVFDPFGLLAPITVRAKVMLQKLWQVKLAWDDTLPGGLQSEWLAYRSEISQMEDIRVPRCVRWASAGNLSLHGFCDASETAYAAAAYIRMTSRTGEVYVRLLAARTKVAPLKATTLPRLELCGAVLLAKLVQTIQSSLKRKIEEVHAWSDSTIVLAWIASPPKRWKTFVANRVAEVQSIIPAQNWHHIAGTLNPADCASRGVAATELRNKAVWWEGPLFLRDELPSTENSVEEPSECEIEERKVRITVHTVTSDDLLCKYSTIAKLKRVTAYVQRFVFNCRLPDHTARRTGPLSRQETDEALFHWVRVVQKKEFEKESTALKVKGNISNKSKLLTLHPFLDEKAILRVGGRLTHAGLPQEETHPIILPRGGKLTELVIDGEHIRQLHGGPQLTLTCLRRRFWILGARDAVRLRLSRCVTCARHRAATVKQIMGNLPRARTVPERPFRQCGVDYAGPFLLRVVKGRGHKKFKAYIALFVCFVTRAIHLELVSDLTAEAFLASLKRFVARRGRCADIYSDCGTNFVAADRELREFVEFAKSAPLKDKVSGWLSDESITWHFNPPAAPHFGGLWEAGVKSVKYHLRRTMGSACLTFEEMQTLLCQVEACLNSRPLSALTNDPTDFSALTPGHFLIGEAPTALPEPDIRNQPMNRLTRWQVSQRVLQHFWTRWKSEYLARLQQRPKWFTKEQNLRIGDLVLLKENDLPPTKWKMGRVLHLHPGEDGCVRVVTIRTANGQYKRPIVKLCVLPLD